MVGALYLWKKYGDAGELAWLDEALKWLTIYEVDEETIKIASQVRSEAILRGEAFYDIDLLIAVSGKSSSSLLTFDRDQLRLKDYLENIGITIITSEA